MLTTRFSSAAWSGRTSALPAGNRADVSSTTRTPTLAGTRGSTTVLFCTGAPVLLLAVPKAESRSEAAWLGTQPITVTWFTSNTARIGGHEPSGSVGGGLVGPVAAGFGATLAGAVATTVAAGAALAAAGAVVSAGAVVASVAVGAVSVVGVTAASTAVVGAATVVGGTLAAAVLGASVARSAPVAPESSDFRSTTN